MHKRSLLLQPRSALLAALTLVVFLAELRAANSSPAFWRWAARPPMGWNSWDCFATTVTEAQTKAQADYMARHLKPHGWEYIVVDIQWYEPNARSFEYRRNATLVLDEFGRLLPATNRFPSAADGVGFKALADYVHGKGLKFGIHLMRGIPRQAVRENTPVKGTAVRARDIANTNSICEWNPDMFGVDMTRPGAQEYYDSVFELIAAWGVDYVKVDDLSRPYHANEKEVEAIRKAIDRAGRPMVLSLSPGETALTAAAHVKQHANLWRISDDFWDNWPALWEQFERLHHWNPHRGPGHWPDADMLPLGVLDLGRRQTRFTPDEQRTLMTLWSIARSPLMHGGDMTKMDDFTLSLLTNDEVLAVNQASANNRQLVRRGDLVAWVADVPGASEKFLALFNAPPPAKPAEDRALFRSPTITRTTPGQGLWADVDLAGARKLFLVITGGDGDNFGDHADWIEPRVQFSGREIKLAETKWTSATTGWGGLKPGESAGGKPIRVLGTNHTEAIGAHALSVIEYDLPAGATRFKAFCALDDAAVAHPRGATVQFMVFTNHPLPEARAQRVPVELAELGFNGRVLVRDLWQRRDLGGFAGEFAPELPPHGAGLYRLTAQPSLPPRSHALPPDQARGLIALVLKPRQVYLGWRWRGSDPTDAGFNLYRSPDGGPWMKLNISPLRVSTDFVDKTVTLSQSNAWCVRLVADGRETGEPAIVSLPPNSEPRAYHSIPLQGHYPFSKVALADLDGDGEMDFVIKQPQQVSDPGVWKPSEDTFKVEAYRSDGTFLWRRDLGWNIEQGVWWSPMIAADFDGDGRAEVALKTAPHEPVYRNEAGRILDGPEFLSVWDGLTGRDVARVDWPSRGRIEDWGDNKGNRASRHLIGLARLDGRRTSVLAMRGTYTTMLVDAYHLTFDPLPPPTSLTRKARGREGGEGDQTIGGRLETVWKWNGDLETPKVRGQGMHGAHAVDVDGDGREEVVLGAAVIDDNGKTLWNLGMGHPDVCYVTDVIPSRPGLEIAYGFETAQEKNGFSVVDAKTGKILWGCDHLTSHVHSQGLLADIDPANPGMEFYGGEKFLEDRWLYSAADGRLLSREDFGTLAPNPIYWDDSYVKPYLTRGGDIVKYKGDKLGAIEGRVIAIADILGDWREEIITTVPGELRIYTTIIPTTRRHVWLMEDPIYRNDVALAAMGYLYPPQLTRPMTAETKP